MVRKHPKREPKVAKRATAWSHVVHGAQGPQAAMVDVSSKAVTQRDATARAVVRFPPGLLKEVLAGHGPKGPALETARIAAIQAVKRTGELIPLCHPLAIDAVEVQFSALDAARMEIRCHVACSARTGVEMEAMVGATLAALTIYDMAKARSHEIEIESVQLLEKRGGRSGHWVHPHAKEP